ncbi:right-handed parallel beta-helix repeat-containing protein [Nitrospira sp. Ecomares 2.1]
MGNCNKHQGIKVSLCCVLFIVSYGITGIKEANAKDYFVSATDGKDENTGTKEAPFFTLEKGLSVLYPGDTLLVRGGTYQRNHEKWGPASGVSWTKPVVIKAYQNEKVIVKPLPSTNFPGNSVFYFKDNTQYIIMDGLTVDGTNGGYGYRMGTGSHHIRVSNGEIKNTSNSAIQGSGAPFIEILNVKIHDSWLGTKRYTTGERSYGFYLNGDYNLVKDCEFYSNHGRGIHIYSATRRPSNNLIINNKFYDNDMVGLGIYSGDGNVAINNVFWNNERGIHVDYGATNTIVYNNTFYSNNGEEILLGPESDRSFVKNNLVVGTNSGPVLLAINGSGASEIENNLILGNSMDPNDLLKISDKSVISSGNLIGNSYKHGLKNPANFDFHIKETSSAIGAGLPLSEVKTDIEGEARNSIVGFDIGAYQFSGVNSLDPPTDLRISR